MAFRNLSSWLKGREAYVLPSTEQKEEVRDAQYIVCVTEGLKEKLGALCTEEIEKLLGHVRVIYQL